MAKSFVIIYLINNIREVTMLKRVFSILMITTLIVVSLTGCTETVQEKQDNKATAVQTEQKNDKTQQNNSSNNDNVAETFKIGDTVKMDKLQITLNGIRYSNGSEFLKPEEGKIFAIVDVTMENLDTKSQTVSSMLMFKMSDKDGYNYNSTISDDVKAQLDGEIGASRKMRGEVSFEIPKDATGLELLFKPNPFIAGQAIFKLDK